MQDIHQPINVLHSAHPHPHPLSSSSAAFLPLPSLQTLTTISSPTLQIPCPLTSASPLTNTTSETSLLCPIHREFTYFWPGMSVLYFSFIHLIFLLLFKDFSFQPFLFKFPHSHQSCSLIVDIISRM